MVPPVVSVVIYGDRTVKIPEMGQKVRMRGLTESFIVVRIDRAQRVADLMSTTGAHSLKEAVPFRSIAPVIESHDKN